jgi:abortive infection bacteriophage resistance protein
MWRVLSFYRGVVLAESVRFLSIDDRIEDLRKRGLEIQDEEQARILLERIGQYRLKQYWYPFLDQGISGRKIFKPGHSFDEVVDLYFMDRELRWLLNRPLETLELNLRSSIATVLQRRKKTFGVYEPSFLKDHRGKARSASLHSAAIKHKDNYKFLETYEEQAYPEIVNYSFEAKKAYLQDKVQYPIWLMVEAITFTDLSLLYDGIADKEIRDEITARFPLWDEYAMRTFVKRVSVLRNSVAHHGRVWNKSLAFPGRLPYFMNDYYPLKTNLREYEATTLFDVLTLFLDITPNLDGDYWWNSDIHEFVNKQPAWVLREMGFPSNWRDFNHWQPLQYE